MRSGLVMLPGTGFGTALTDACMAAGGTPRPGVSGEASSCNCGAGKYWARCSCHDSSMSVSAEVPGVDYCAKHQIVGTWCGKKTCPGDIPGGPPVLTPPTLAEPTCPRGQRWMQVCGVWRCYDPMEQTVGCAPPAYTPPSVSPRPGMGSGAKLALGAAAAAALGFLLGRKS